MIVLNNLTAICGNLNEIELKYIRGSLKSNGHANSSSLILLDTVVSNRNIGFDALSEIIYKKRNYEALKKLIQRLIDKILDVLISKEVINDSGIYDERNVQVFSIRRKLLYYDILNIRGISNYALVILDQIIKSCTKFEYYDYLIMALEKKLVKVSLGDGSDEYKRVYRQIEFYSDCNLSLKRARYFLRLYYTNNRYAQKIYTNEELNTAVDKVKEDFTRTKSNNVRIQYHYLYGLLLSSQGKYKECYHNFISLNKFLNLNRNFYSSFTFVNCWLNLAECEIMLCNFESSLSYLKLIRSKSSQGEFNDKMLLEKEYLNYFYLGDLEKCDLIMDDLIENSGYAKTSNFIVARRYFYSAVLYFLRGNFIESSKILNKCKILDLDKEGWNLGVRLLLIYNSIELGKWVLAESMIENLRKHISRVDDLNLNPRFLYIAKLLIALERASFDFHITSKKYAKEIRTLNGMDRKFIAPLNSPELILFHEWFDSKLKGIPYNHVEAMKRLVKANKQTI